MRIETLEAYDVPKELLALWRETVGPELLPVQERAVKEFGLFSDDNLIVFAPTSSGKTFIGEMAAVKAARANRKVLYLVPQKALAEEKFQELRRRYARVGLQVVVSSRDHREFDEAIERRDFQIAVVVFEKLQTLLLRRPQLMEAVGLVVVDELQVLTDEARGPSLELLLTQLKGAGSRPRILGLSAVLGHAQVLADWLGAKLLVDERRPVELRKGVLCRGTFSYREHNSHASGEEVFTDQASGKRHELILAAAEELARRGEQVLVFLPDRGATVSFARALASRLSLPAVEPALEELREQEDTYAREVLREVLGSGVAFHNADLTPEERGLVERHFREGGIRVLLSTSTLSTGLNLPAKNVLIDARRWQFLPRYGRWSLEDLPKSDYENMSGRAGRLSLTSDFGRSILVTNSEFEAEVLLEHYSGPGFEQTGPALQAARLETPVLGLLAAGLVRSRQELRALLLASFTGSVYWQKAEPGALDVALDQALALGVRGGLVHAGEDGQLSATELGRISASQGLGVQTAVALAAWVRETGGAALSALEVLTLVGQTPAGREVYVSLGGNERFQGDFLGEILGRASGAGVAERPVFARLSSEVGVVDHHERLRALKKVLVLADWIEEVDTRELEERYQLWAGAIRRVGEEYGWLVDALAQLARASGWAEARWKPLEELADRLAHGVKADALPIATLRARGLGRGLARRLVDRGLSDVEALRTAGPVAVREALPNRGTVFAALWARVSGRGELEGLTRYMVEERKGPRRAAEPAPSYGAPAAPLVVDLRAGRVTFRGHEVRTRPPEHLQRQPLLALAVLARRPGELVTLKELAEELARLGGLRKRPRSLDARSLRYRILRPFKKALSGKVEAGELERLIESVPGKGLRLNLEGRPEVLLPSYAKAA